MSPLGAFLLLLSGTFAWFLLPLLPALRELLWPTDISPLRVVERDAGDLSFFARGFRNYLRRQLARLPTDAPDDLTGSLPDRTPFVRGPVLAPDLEREAATEAGLDRVLVLAAPATLAGNLSFPRELYATADFSGGERNMYRAVLGDARVALGPASAVLRWAHAAGDLVAGDGVTLSGRASSDRAIRLGSLVRFDRLAAPVILVGEVASGPATASTAATPYTPPPDRSRQIGDHLRVEGDLTIPPGASLDANLVVAGDVTLGAGARLGGSLKAHGAVVLGAGAEIAGAVVSRTTVRTGAAAIVGGPVVAEESVELGSATRVGDPAHPTSIASPHVLLGLGVQVCGLITATEGGTTA
jgi:hypothetical protein